MNHSKKLLRCGQELFAVYDLFEHGAHGISNSAYARIHSWSGEKMRHMRIRD